MKLVRLATGCAIALAMWVAIVRKERHHLCRVVA